jgi:ribA/ribD-fused uncharacterized protein
MPDEINSFRGEYNFLSNFYLRGIVYGGMAYPALENAFQAQKTTDKELRMEFMFLAPGQAKRRGRKLDIRKDWDCIRNGVMLDLLRIKFSDDELGVKLLATHPKNLVEGNTWGDEYWGVCNGSGKNMLGKLLMKVRREVGKERGVLRK